MLETGASALRLELLPELCQLLAHARVPVIFYCVVSASLQNLSDVGPLVAVLAVTNVEDPLFFFAPLVFLDHGVQMVVPAFATLLANPAIQRRSNLGPLLRSFFLH